jgi:hypothetical protein
METHPLIAAALAAPKTHRVVTTYDDGAARTFDTRNAASAELHAIGERRKIGRELIARETGKTVRVVSVEVAPISTTVEVFDFMLHGRGIGCGTKFEFEYLKAEGILPEETALGEVIGCEPASEDERRKAAWAKL